MIKRTLEKNKFKLKTKSRRMFHSQRPGTHEKFLKGWSQEEEHKYHIQNETGSGVLRLTRSRLACNNRSRNSMQTHII